MKGWLGRLALLLAGTTIALLIVEGALRLRHPCRSAKALFTPLVAGPVGMYISDADTIMRPKEGFQGVVRAPGCAIPLRFNRLGLRGPEPEDTDQTPWLLLGDSFALGIHVEESETLAGRLGPRFQAQVWNAGVETYSTMQAVGRYRQLREALPFEQVILLLYAGNDMMDNNHFTRPRWAGGTPPPVPYFQSMQPVYTFLTRRSAIAALWAHQRRRQDMLRGTEGNRNRWQDELAFYRVPRIARRRMEKTRAALRQLKQEVKRDGRALLVAVAPPTLEMNPEEAAKVFAAMGIPEEQVDLRLPRRLVREVLHDLNIASCELLIPLQAARAPLLVFDGHFSVDGHAAAAEGIAACLEAQ
ncbi:MAG: hypothetical protein AAFV53_00970 [Myxococcota bacterium]